MRREEGKWQRKRTAASCSAGSFAHCVYPIVLSKPLTLTKNHASDVPLIVSAICSSPVRAHFKGTGKNERTLSRQTLTQLIRFFLSQSGAKNEPICSFFGNSDS
jgi:hypothetical protein